MATTYAYTDIHYGADVDGPASQAAGQVGTFTKIHMVKRGEKVTQSLGNLSVSKLYPTIQGMRY